MKLTRHRLLPAPSPAYPRPSTPPNTASSSSPSSSSSSSITPGLASRQAFVHTLADAAGDITRAYFRTPVSVDTKADASPVTIADREAEAAMRRLIHAKFPHDAVFGEEAGLSHGCSEAGEKRDPSNQYTWILDPIDGTKSFITGRPLFGTLIALLEAGLPVLGVIDQSISRERWVGVRGLVTTHNDKPVQTRDCETLDKAVLNATTPEMFRGVLASKFAAVSEGARLTMFGSDCYAYGLCAMGLVDVVCEADLKVYDYMACIPIIEGAGGVVTDWRGEELRWEPGREMVNEVLAAGDRRTHAQALAILKEKVGSH